MQAPDGESSIPLWVRIGYIPLVALMGLIAYRIDLWFGHAVFILLTFVATWFVEPKARRVTRFGHAMFALTLLLATLFIQYLNAPDRVATIEESRILHFFLGGIGARATVSVVSAFFTSTVLLLGPILLVLYASIEWILAMPEVYSVTRWQAMRLLLSLVFNTSYPYYLVENGEMTLSKPSGVLPALGGPGVAVIKPYNAVVFERSGNITRVEGPGMFMTKRFEFVKEVINLRKQWIDFYAENVLTKDHVPLTFHCGVGFRIEARKDTAKRVEERSEAYEGSRFVGIIGGDYPVYKRTIYRAVYNTTAAGWRFLSKGATETKLREVLREYRLEDLYHLKDNQLTSADSVVDDIAEEVIRRVGAVSPTWGTTVYGLTIRSFEAPENVKARLLEMWSKRYAVRTLLMGATGDRDAALTKLEADEAVTIRIAEAERDAALAKLLADRQRIISLGDAERLAIGSRASGERQALLESAGAEREAERIKAEGSRETARIRAEALLEDARAGADAAIIKGRGEAEARVELFRRMLELQPTMDAETLWEILKRLCSVDELRSMTKWFFELDSRRYQGRVEQLAPPVSDKPEKEREQ